METVGPSRAWKQNSRDCKFSFFLHRKVENSLPRLAVKLTFRTSGHERLSSRSCKRTVDGLNQSWPTPVRFHLTFTNIRLHLLVTIQLQSSRFTRHRHCRRACFLRNASNLPICLGHSNRTRRQHATRQATDDRLPRPPPLPPPVTIHVQLPLTRKAHLLNTSLIRRINLPSLFSFGGCRSSVSSSSSRFHASS